MKHRLLRSSHEQTLSYDKTSPEEMQHTHLLIPDREARTDQSTNTNKVQPGEPMSFIGVNYRNMGEEILTKEKIVSKTAASPKSTPAW